MDEKKMMDDNTGKMDDNVQPVTTTTDTTRPGRPRQPYCPDCRRAGRPNVPKAPGQGYCKEDIKRRQRDSRRAATEEIDVTDAREKNYRDEIETLRAEVTAARLECDSLRRTLLDPVNMVPEELEAEHERALRKEMVKYKAKARGLLYDIRNGVADPDRYPETDPEWDF